MGAGIDVSFDCAGLNKTMSTVLDATRAGDKVCLVGMGHHDMTVPLTPAAARYLIYGFLFFFFLVLGYSVIYFRKMLYISGQTPKLIQATLFDLSFFFFIHLRTTPFRLANVSLNCSLFIFVSTTKSIWLRQNRFQETKPIWQNL